MWALLERWRIDLSCSHVCMSHGTHAIESWRTHGEVMSHIWMSRVNQSYYISEHPWNVGALSRVMASIWTSHVTRMIELRHTHIISHGTRKDTSSLWHIRTSHVTRTNEARHRSEYSWNVGALIWVVAHVWMSHGTHINESWRTHG